MIKASISAHISHFSAVRLDPRNITEAWKSFRTPFSKRPVSRVEATPDGHPLQQLSSSVEEVAETNNWTGGALHGLSLQPHVSPESQGYSPSASY